MSRVERPVRKTFLAGVCALGCAIGSISVPAFAQDGTGAATPTPPSTCEVIAATVTNSQATVAPASTPIPITSPAASTPLASPVSGASASSPVPSAADSSTSLEQDLDATATAIAGCLSDQQFDTLATLTSDTWRGQFLGLETANPKDFIALAGTLPPIPYQIISVDNVKATAATTATADVTYESAHQVRTSTWEFRLTDVGGTQAWVLNSETPMAVEIPADAAKLSVTMSDGTFVVDPATVQGPVVAITASNSGTRPHEVLILRFEDGVTTDALLTYTGTGLPKGVTYIGQATVPSGANGTMLLGGLTPGTYTIVDLLPNADGLPNLVDGMTTTFKVS